MPVRLKAIIRGPGTAWSRPGKAGFDRSDARVGWAKSPAAALEYVHVTPAILPTLSTRDRTAWATAKRPLPTLHLKAIVPEPGPAWSGPTGGGRT